MSRTEINYPLNRNRCEAIRLPDRIQVQMFQRPLLQIPMEMLTLASIRSTAIVVDSDQSRRNAQCTSQTAEDRRMLPIRSTVARHRLAVVTDVFLQNGRATRVRMNIHRS